MKNYLTLLLLAILSITLHSQSKQQFNHKVDSVLKTHLENNLYLDTLWVLDSSLYFEILNSPAEFTHAKTYKVLSRNENGNPLTSSDLVSDSYPGIYLNNDYDSIIYFDGSQIKKHYSNVWNTVTQEWIDNEYKEYETPNLTKEIFNKNFWDGVQQYNGWRELYENENGKINTLIFETYVPETDLWLPKTKTIHYYDEQGNDTLLMKYSWKNNSWIDSVKYQQHFESNLLAFIVGQRIDTVNSTWKNYVFYSYSYTNDRLVDTAILKYWSSQNNSWHDNFKTVLTYDDNNRLTNRLQMIYNNITQQLENNNKYIVNYQTGSKTEVFQSWYMPSGPWINQYQYYTSFVTEDIVDTIQYNVWNSNTQQWRGNDRTVNVFDNRFNVIESIQSYFLNDEWHYSTKTDYFWSTFIPNAINENSTNALAVYPNPASTQITFVLVDILPKQGQEISVKIFNISGQKITEIPLKEGKVIWDCSTAKTGLYIYSTYIEGLLYTGKIIVR